MGQFKLVEVGQFILASKLGGGVYLYRYFQQCNPQRQTQGTDLPDHEDDIGE
jgi:hypothetical protein